MSLSLDLAAALNPLVGQTFVPPKTVSVSDGSGVTLAVDLISVESLGVSSEELRLDVPSLGAATLELLESLHGLVDLRHGSGGGSELQG